MFSFLYGKVVITRKTTKEKLIREIENEERYYAKQGKNTCSKFRK